MRTTSQCRRLFANICIPAAHRRFMAELGYHLVLWVLLGFVYIVVEISQFRSVSRPHHDPANRQNVLIRDSKDIFGRTDQWGRKS